MWRWVKSGKIQSFITPGGHYRIATSDIDTLFMNNQRSKTDGSMENSILIIDNDTIFHTMLKKRLIGENYCVASASNGFLAGLKIQNILPNLVILDLMMEEINGFAICRTIKSHEILKDTRILILADFDTSNNRKKAIQEGADDYLPKTGSIQVIVHHINVLFENNTGPRST